MGKKRFRIFTILSLSVLLFMIACSGGGGGPSSVTVTHLAGPLGGHGSADGTGTLAGFYYPSGIASDGTNLYAADSYNNTIRKIVIATGKVTTLAGTAGSSGFTDGTGAAARFINPSGITSDGANLYVTDSQNTYLPSNYNNTIRKIVIATGEVTTLAGIAGCSSSASACIGSTDGTGAAARFYYPSGITNDGTNLYVVDRGNNTIRKIVIATGEVTTLVGTAGSWGSTDGTGAAALFNSPSGITSDGTNLYVADTYNHTIRKIVIATGEVTTLAGAAGGVGSTDGTGAAASFNYPSGITNDGTNLYVADTYNNTIRKIVIATGEVTTLAGAAGSFGSTDGTGAAAGFNNPEGITNDGTNLYVADTYNNTIRKIVIATGEVTTLAGMADGFGSTDGMGAAARFYNPSGITSDGTNLYVADTYNHTIRKIVIATGEVTTLAGTAGLWGVTDGIGAAARFYYPEGITSDGTNLYVTDTANYTIRKIVIATGAVTTLAGAAGRSGSTDGTGAAARFNLPSGITNDGTNLYVADTYNSMIRKIVIATGEVTTLAGTASSNGSVDGTGAAAGFNNPEGITSDGTNLYVTDCADSYSHMVAAHSYSGKIRKIVIATGEVTTLAGGVSFKYPKGITNDGTNLYVADTYNNTIRQIVIATGEVITLAGTAGSSGSTDGIGAAALFYNPSGITSDGTNLYVTDTGNNAIRMIRM